MSNETGPVESGKNLLSEFKRLRKHVGTPIAVIILVIGLVVCVWWNWDRVMTRPGAERIVGLIMRPEIVAPKPGHIVIAIAHFADDEGQRYETLLRTNLAYDFNGAVTVGVGRTITPSDGITDQEAIESARKQAEIFREQAGADVLIWGQVITIGGARQVRLNWTGASAKGKISDIYSPITNASDTTISLPPLFWDDLKQIIGVLIQSRIAALNDGRTYEADKLKLLIDQTKSFLQARKGSWDANTEALVRLGLADALLAYGHQAGNDYAVAESIASYQLVLGNFTSALGPHDCASAESNLGNALLDLGAHEPGTSILDAAITAYRAALTVFTRNQTPSEWAIVQSNIGNVLTEKATHGSSIKSLQEAIVAYNAALEVWTKDKDPLNWAGTESNLGNALTDLSYLSGDATDLTDLEAAIKSNRAALTILDPTQMPLFWAAAEGNLGRALQLLGTLESGTPAAVANLQASVQAFNAAMKVFSRDRLPADWAKAQNNLGSALQALGEQGGGTPNATAYLQSATEAYRGASEVFAREKLPRDWAQAQNNLGNALQDLGESDGSALNLQASISAYLAALTVFTRDQTPVEWAEIQCRMGTSLLYLNAHGSSTKSLQDAIVAYNAALEVWTKDKDSLNWASAETNLGLAYFRLALHESPASNLKASIAAYHASLTVLMQNKSKDTWRIAQDNLGDALSEMAKHEKGTKSLRAAVAAWTASEDANDFAALLRQTDPIQLKIQQAQGEIALRRRRF